MCGTATRTNGTTLPTNGHATPAVNTFELQEDVKSRTVRLHLTDEAVSHVGDALTAVFADRIVNRPRPTQRIPQAVTLQAALELPAPAAVSGVDTPAASAPPPPAPGGDQERLRQIFEYAGDELRLEEDRLKADSGQDYARRLTYLFLYAHELEGRKPLPIASLKKILETARLWEDANVRHALTHKMAVEIENDQMRLKKAGRESAVTALGEILNPCAPRSGLDTREQDQSRETAGCEGWQGWRQAGPQTLQPARRVGATVGETLGPPEWPLRSERQNPPG
jgi:hypothetical protein